MWVYEKKLEYPVKIKNPNPKLAKYIISQYGGPDGELAASLRYLSQRFSMPTNEAKGILNDIGTEELAHLEMIGAIVYQLTRGVPADVLERVGLGAYYTDHDHAVYPMSASGTPFTAAYIQSKGDPIADLHEDMAAEQKARATYENLIKVLLALFTIFIISPSALLSPIPFLLILAITLSLCMAPFRPPEGMNISFMFSSSGIKNP